KRNRFEVRLANRTGAPAGAARYAVRNASTARACAAYRSPSGGTAPAGAGMDRGVPMARTVPPRGVSVTTPTGFRRPRSVVGRLPGGRLKFFDPLALDPGA